MLRTVWPLLLGALGALGCHDCPDGILWEAPGVRVRAGDTAATSQAHVYATVAEYYFFDDHGGDETSCTTRDSSSIQVTLEASGVVKELGAQRELDLVGLAPEYVFRARRGGDKIETVARAPSFFTVAIAPDPPRAGQPLTVTWSSHGDPDTWLCIDVHDVNDASDNDRCAGPSNFAPSPQGRSILAPDTGQAEIDGFYLLPKAGDYEIDIHRVRQPEAYVDGYQSPWVDVAYGLQRMAR